MGALTNPSRPAAAVSRAVPLPFGQSFASGLRPHEWNEREPDANDRRRETDQYEPIASEAEVAISSAAFVTRRRFSWRGMAAESIGIAQHGRLEIRFRASVHLLVLLECGARSEESPHDKAPPRPEPEGCTRELILVPAGHEYVERRETRRFSQLAFFYLDPGTVSLDSAASLAPRLFFDDVELWITALKLAAAIETPDVHGRDYCDALGVVLAHDLVRLAPGARRVERQFRGGLAGWQQKAVTSYIDERLAEQVSLDALAALVHLSRFHFCRVFKQSFGVPPLRFHMHRRIERAKALLADSEMSTTEVGMAVGFGSGSTFAKSFRKLTGVTATEFRRTVI